MKKSKRLILVLTGAILLFGSMQGFSASKYLSMSRYYQQKSEWSWAAVIQIAWQYYNSLYRWQCKIASPLFASESYEFCCGPNNEYADDTPYPEGSEEEERCNRSVPPSLFLTVSTFDQIQPGLLATSRIIAEINASHLIALLIYWDYGGRQYILLHGYNTTASPDRFFLWDPLHGAQYLTRDGINDYRGAGFCGYSFTRE